MVEEKKINRFYRIVQNAKEKEDLILLERRKNFLKDIERETKEEIERRLLRRPEPKSIVSLLRRDNIRYENRRVLLRRKEESIEQETIEEVKKVETDVKNEVKKALRTEEMLIFKIREKRDSLNRMQKAQTEHLSKRK